VFAQVRITLIRAWFAIVAMSGWVGCTCSPSIQNINPSLALSPPSLDFSVVKVGTTKSSQLQLVAETEAPVVVSSIVVEGSGASAFGVSASSAEAEPFGSASITVTFSPTETGSVSAVLVVTSNDPERPVVRMPLVGEGSLPIIEVVTECASSRGCRGTASAQPLSIDFGAESVVRQTPLEVSTLPTVTVANKGRVPLQVLSLEIEGVDEASFQVVGAGLSDGGLVLNADTGFNVPVRFAPTSEQKTNYQATLVIRSDDATSSSTPVQLRGALQPNTAPVVCANVVRVVPQSPEESPREYDSPAEWVALQNPASGAYDFSTRRDIRPGDAVVLSATSDAADDLKCSTDAEDGRDGMTYAWRVRSSPGAAVPLVGANASRAQFRPLATGEYLIELTVTDSQGRASSVTLRLVVAVKQDLVAQLEWTGFSGVDFDLHLVRPPRVPGTNPFADVFSFFSQGRGDKTSSDLNGFSQRTRDANAAAGYNFDWGLAGGADDPILNVDDRGNGALVENASLNFPENDAACATAWCTYRVMVHHFADERGAMGSASCAVDGGIRCRDGEQCSCAPSLGCIADTAPAGMIAAGPGKCFQSPQVTVKLFLKGSSVPERIIPVSNSLSLGAPCLMWHVADVSWPPKTLVGSLADGGTPSPIITVVGDDGMGRVPTPTVARFGVRPVGGALKCSPDSMPSGVDWYSRQP
jgi:hypothetical protein